MSRSLFSLKSGGVDLNAKALSRDLPGNIEVDPNRWTVADQK
jgi:hypothetical protein